LVIRQTTNGCSLSMTDDLSLGWYPSLSLGFKLCFYTTIWSITLRS